MHLNNPGSDSDEWRRFLPAGKEPRQRMRLFPGLDGKSVWRGLLQVHLFLRWVCGLCLLLLAVITSWFVLWLGYRLVMRLYHELQDVL